MTLPLNPKSQYGRQKSADNSRPPSVCRQPLTLPMLTDNTWPSLCLQRTPDLSVSADNHKPSLYLQTTFDLILSAGQHQLQAAPVVTEVTCRLLEVTWSQWNARTDPGEAPIASYT